MRNTPPLTPPRWRGEHIGSYIFSFFKNEKIVCLTYLILSPLLFFFLSSCSVSKYIPQGESLYTGAKIKTTTDSSFTKDEIKVLNGQLKTIIRPVPNSSVFGFPYKVWFYYDQNGTYTSKLNIKHVPAMVEQEGTQIKITELANNEI